MSEERREYGPFLSELIDISLTVDGSCSAQRASWERYYDSKIMSFRPSEQYYSSLLRDSAKKIGLLSSASPRTFLLGGFHPNNGTPQEFIRFCQKIHRNPSDAHYLLDMNEAAVSKAPEGPTIKPVLQRLEAMDFARSSLDFIFLDGTVDFMDDDQIIAFVEKAVAQLTPNGVVLVKKSYRLALEFSISQSVSRYPRTLEQFLDVVKPLKPVGFRTQPYRGFSYVALAKPESEYAKAIPSNFELEEKYNPFFFNPLDQLTSKIG